jgi:hypothetical protein
VPRYSARGGTSSSKASSFTSRGRRRPMDGSGRRDRAR